MSTHRPRNRAVWKRWLTWAGLGLLLSAGLAAHEPHKPLPAVAPAGVLAPTAVALPAGWVESPPPSAVQAFAPMLTADGDGVLATWLEPIPAGGHRVRLARWAAGAWSAATTVREGKKLFANWADVPGVVRAPDGALLAWWLESSGADTYAYDALLARSTDGGVTFRVLGALHEDRSAVEHGFVSAVVEGAGVRFFFLDGRATATGAPMQLRTVLVAGERIGPSELIDESVCDCCATAAVGWAGGSAVAYRDRTAAEIRDVQVAIRPLVGGLATHAVGNDNWKIAGCPVNGPALAGDGRRMAVAWYTAPEDRARMAVALSPDGGTSWGVPRALPGGGAGKPMGQLALAPLPGGFAAAWLEHASDSTELRFALLDASGKAGPAVLVARLAVGRAAGIPRLARTPERLTLAWVDARAQRLRFAALAAP